MNYVRFTPPPNDQRTDPAWNWDGIKIGGNSQCQGNSNEDILKAIGMEFEIPDFAKINTFNYYAMYFGFLKATDPDVVKRDEMMDFRHHANFLATMCETNQLPVKIVVYSSIGDKPLKVGGIREIKKFDGSPEFLAEKLEKTRRIISVGTLELPSGHWKRYHAFDEIKKRFRLNDPYGTPPYKTAKEKKAVEVEQTYEQAKKSVLRRLIVIEDK